MIMAGGGTKGSYSAGVILGLFEKFDLEEPEMFFTGSVGSTTASYYVAKQYDSIFKIWSNLVSTKKFINFMRPWKIMDINYLVYDVFKKQEPLNEQAVYNSKTKLFISSTNAKTGKLEFFSNHEGENIFEMIRASTAMPLAYHENVQIRGQKYVDTYLSSLGLNLKIQKAKQEGAKKIIIISPLQLDKNYRALMKKGVNTFVFNSWKSSKSKEFRKNYKEQWEFDQQEHNYDDLEIFTISPSERIKMGMLNNNNRKLNNVLAKGYFEAIENEKLESFLL